MSCIDFEHLSINRRRDLIDFVEGMPSVINKRVKMMINEHYMDPCMYKGSSRNLHEYCTITKFLSNRQINNVALPSASYYQSDYCTMMEQIYDKNIMSGNSRLMLFNLANSESYDNESMIELEIAIAKELKINSGINKTDFSYMINQYIMPYKYKVYDAYTRIILSPDIELDDCDGQQMYRIWSYINNSIKTAPSYYSTHNLPILLYIYFKQLGIEQCVRKYNLFDRFKYDILHLHNHLKIDEFVSKIENDLNFMIDENRGIAYASSQLIGINDNINHIKTDHSNISGSIHFLFKNLDLTDDDKESLGVNINKLTKKMISDYIPSVLNPDNEISFFLTSNDICHLMKFDGTEIGSVYDKFSYSVKVIGKFNDDFYLFFKVKNKESSGHIYGISINTIENGCRKIFDMKRSNNFVYKFIPEL